MYMYVCVCVCTYIQSIFQDWQMLVDAFEV
jgi:hypothetical protein